MSGSYGHVGHVKDMQVDLAIDSGDSAIIFSVFEEGVEISPVELTVAEATKLSCIFRDAARYLASHERQMREGSPDTMRLTLYESTQRYKVGELITFELKEGSNVAGTYEVVNFSARLIADKGPDTFRWIYSLRKVKK